MRVAPSSIGIEKVLQLPSVMTQGSGPTGGRPCSHCVVVLLALLPLSLFSPPPSHTHTHARARTLPLLHSRDVVSSGTFAWLSRYVRSNPKAVRQPSFGHDGAV